MAVSSAKRGKSSAAAGGGAGPAVDWSAEGLYPISVVTEMTGLGPHTLRGYERAGLLRPARTEGGMRLYSPRDVAVVRRAAELTAEGVNLAGVRRILALEADLTTLRAEIAALRAPAGTASP